MKPLLSFILLFAVIIPSCCSQCPKSCEQKGEQLCILTFLDTKEKPNKDQDLKDAALFCAATAKCKCM